MNNHQAPIENTLLRVFDRLGAKRWLYMSVLCSVSECIHRNLPEEAHVPVTLLKTWINLINLNQARPILQNSRDTILLICMWNWAFMAYKSAPLKWGAIIVLSRFTVFSKSLEAEIETDFQLIEQPYKELHSSP